ncbi:MAG TPA: helix-turn-helix domain-containing protein [Solirubrobacterales bacterium]|jgi:predicted ArsR family transcriptional regulator|nr:helix-turn-helix domain-containing protein [Solirubrobacterales bacterium]
MSGKRTVQLTDPRALRALAHPVRMDLMGLLRRGGPLTATQAGEEIGESAASCSFHLRQLAKYGLVEEAGGGRGRERPWRATAISTEWAARGSDEETDAAGTLLSRVVIERYLQNAIEWLERRGSEDSQWVEAAMLNDALIYMTVEELRQLDEKIRALLEPYLQRLEKSEPPAEGARPVNVIALAFPLPPSRGGDDDSLFRYA